MILKQSELAYCLAKAAEMTELYKQYVLHADRYPRSVDDLHWIGEQYLKLRIIRRELDIPAEGSSIRAFFLALDDSFEIYLMGGMNFCWRRFCECKELFHAFLNDDQWQTIDIYGHLDEVATSFPVADSRPGPAVISEVMAEIAAMEFLFPYHTRADSLRQIVKKEKTPLQIAEHFKVPQYYVEGYLSQQMIMALRPQPQHLAAQ